jgi:RNA polymerase sigma-70 factor, ECF subfamily
VENVSLNDSPLLDLTVAGDYIAVDRDRQGTLYEVAAGEFGPALDRLAAGYETDPDRRRDLRQEIHLQLWRSLAAFDERCSLKTWTFRVAHNVAVSYVNRERRQRAALVSLEETAIALADKPQDARIDERLVLERLFEMVRTLKTLDRQILLSYLEGMDAAAIAEITGLSAANVSMKVHRIKALLARRYLEERNHA